MHVNGMGWRRAAGRLAAGAGVAVATLVGLAQQPLSQAKGRDISSLVAPLTMVDWQPPLSLPRRFRNHCHYDLNRGGWYCANHCGPDYQVYYCSPASFGCCHPGYGYCDWQGHLRCAP